MATFDHIPEDKRREARMFWERAYDNAVAQTLHTLRTHVVADDHATTASVTELAVLIADAALKHWLERW
jgi:hypothetical protein